MLHIITAFCDEVGRSLICVFTVQLCRV